VVKHGTTFLQAIALAGGLTPFASASEILLLRRSDNSGREVSLKVPYKDIISGRNLRGNILLKPMDTIVVS
jgi:polysaccharide export outer membrane protein